MSEGNKAKTAAFYKRLQKDPVKWRRFLQQFKVGEARLNAALHAKRIIEEVRWEAVIAKSDTPAKRRKREERRHKKDEAERIRQENRSPEEVAREERKQKAKEASRAHQKKRHV